MTKEEALNELARIKQECGTENGHMEADEVLLRLIDDDEVRAAFNALPKWYA